MKTNVFTFKQFEISHANSAMKIGTDGVLLGAWATANNCLRILDIGTGSGIIALMLAQRYDMAIVDAVEIDEASCKEAASNFTNSPWPNRLKAYNLPVQSFASQASYDLIVANPPFFIMGTSPSQTGRHHARHTIRLSQTTLIEATCRFLKPGGNACFILPTLESKAFVESAAQEGLFLVHKTTFIPKEGKPPERFLMKFSKSPSKLAQDTLLHYNLDGSWSLGYKALTKAFHPRL